MGSYWREDGDNDELESKKSNADNLNVESFKISLRTMMAALLLSLSLMIWPLWEQWSSARKPAFEPAHSFIASEGYKLCTSCESPLQPSFNQANNIITQAYKAVDGRIIYVYVASYYSWDPQGELISYQNQLVLPSDDNNHIISRGNYQSYDANYLTIKSKGAQLKAVYWYQLGDSSLSNKVLVKIGEAQRKLFAEYYISQYVAVFTDNGDVEQADKAFNAFLGTNQVALSNTSEMR